MKRINKQRGITLVTSLMMLLVITLMGVAAVKMSTVDLRVANNYQHQVSVYQAAETTLRQDVGFYNLYRWILNKNKQPAARKAGEMQSKATLIDMEREYSCVGIDGRASSLGPDTPPCGLYMFRIESHMKGTGARDTHYQGAGKQLPNASKGSFL